MIFPHRSVSTRASMKLSMRRIEQNLKEAYWDISQCVLIQLMDLLWSGVKLISLFLSDEYSFSTRPDLTQIHLPSICFQLEVDFWIGCNERMSWDCIQQVLIKNISKSYHSIALIFSHTPTATPTKKNGSIFF